MADVSVRPAAMTEREKLGRYIVDENDIENQYLKDALITNKREGLQLAVRARFISLIAIAILTTFLVGDWSVLYYHALIALFMLNGYLQLKVGRVARSRKELLLLFADLTLMAITVGVPNPFMNETWSVALQYKWGNFPYFYVILAGATLIYSWRTMFALAWYTVFIWGGLFWWATYQPNVLPEISAQINVLLADYPDILEQVSLENLSWHSRVQEVVIFVIVCGILSLNMWRSNRLLERQADAARERANLARYFAPSMVDHLAETNDPLGKVREQPVVVMFVDIVGFTKMAEHERPERVVAFLREFHKRMEKVVFEHHGTLDKFLGDGLMITFGTPNTTPQDAENALKCAVEMQASMEEWNQKRIAAGHAPVKLSIGMHYGDVVLGDIGSERRLEYAVLGDVVNVASRLEAITRPMGAAIVASDAVIRGAGKELASDLNYRSAGPQEIRGREEAVEVWSVKRTD
ncbi:adenylate/guanylate cyclase domain-containing protein [Sneathiella limimaris]|uniref:adenylate/guanylate cyclase domain-containing protein n=1 Tax=Sneathiella limimaris TaxID=1964213 RepID=UPI00146ADA1A|nr:adenylate/guanylate cyclase domain-containing protein [Sneathiella limimaris]